ncbi:MAG: glycosyltransferase family 39 protein [Bacteroidales bacterium]|nr:glycosyltransferase family 39 protein [Bacteroidales bacterium]
MASYIEQRDIILYIMAIVLLFPALLINLGNLPLQFPTDEARRALVALEMILSDNYITPTLNGEFYYNKPPLYNWIITGMFKITGGYSELAFRLPVIMTLLLFAFTIYTIARPRFGRRNAFVQALLFVTCGRILFYDSFIGLIDISYSWIVYLNFMCIFLCFESGRLFRLFVISYFLTAVGFLMKGLPSVVFQGLTLIMFFGYNKKFRLLFNYRHFVGIIVFVIIIAAYYLIYISHNPGSIETVFSTLFNQTTQRTVVRFGFFKTLLYILTFPFEMTYHFAPWSFLIIVLAVKGIFRKVLSNDFVKFSLFVFLINIIVYWTSPQTLPRYILMLAPLIFTVFYFAYTELFSQKSRITAILEYLFMGMMWVAFSGSLLLPFLPETKDVPFVVPKTLFVCLLTGFFTLLYMYQKRNRLLLFAITLLVLRIGFNWFVIPPRIEFLEKYKNGALEVARISKGQNLYLFRNSPIQDAATFYIESERGEILYRKHDDFKSEDLYITRRNPGDISDYEVLYDFNIEWEDTPMSLIRIKENSATLKK